MALTKTYSDKKTACKPKTCPTCGGVDCFERPRYFCGQLLTDKDLDAAQRYVIEKNRLHNRYLVGTGVVCGLAVRCHSSCEGVIVIEPGYAIDCCGNDIVLCESAEFDVCDYLKKCFNEDGPDCDGKIRTPISNCDDPPKEYCLILSYKEEPARPITALIRDNGCHTSRCEPSRTKETFRLDLIEKKDLPKTGTPSAWTKISECFKDVSKRATALTRDNAVEHQAQFEIETENDLFFQMKEAVLELYAKGPDIRCTLAEEINQIQKEFLTTSDSDNEYTTTKRNEAAAAMQSLVIQHFVDCLCNALLVPCTPCEEPEGVVLACLTVKDCKIIKICNTARKQVITGPALRYWLGPLSTSFHRLLERLCCEFEPRRRLPTRERVRGVYRSASTGFMRGMAAFKITSSILKARFTQFINPDLQTGGDYLGMNAAEAKMKLREMNVIVASEQVVAKERASAMSSLRSVTESVPPGSTVELIKSPDDNIVAIRVLGGIDNDQR